MVLAVEMDDADTIAALARANSAEISARRRWAFCSDPLHCAAARGKTEMVRVLLEAAGSDRAALVASVTEDGAGNEATAAHFAVLHDRLAVKCWLFT